MYFSIADEGYGQRNLRIGGFKTLKAAYKAFKNGSGVILTEDRKTYAVIENGKFKWTAIPHSS